MTLAQFIEIVRRRHNAEGDSNWSDAEIYQLITLRCNEVLGIIGLLEDTDTDTSVASTQAYDFPSDAVTIRQVNYKASRLQRIPFRKWELYKNETTTPEGLPDKYVIWNRQIHMIPIPDTSGDTITIYNYKEHPYIDNASQTTIDIPSVLHGYLTFGVIADMFTKDLNHTLAQYYEQRWLTVAMPAFYRFKMNEDQGSRGQILGDADTEITTELGPV